MKIWYLIRCEFIKNFSVKKYVWIFLALLVCCFGLIKFENFLHENHAYTDVLSLNDFKSAYRKARNESDRTSYFQSDGVYEIFKRMESSYENAYLLIADSPYVLWQKDAIQNLRTDLAEQVVLEQLRDNPNDSTFSEILANYDYEYNYDIYSTVLSTYLNALKRNIDLSESEILDKLEHYDKNVSLLTYALSQNSYYLYVDRTYQEYVYQINLRDLELSRENVERYQYIIVNQIESEFDYRAVNANQSYYLSTLSFEEPTLEEYNEPGFIQYGSFDSTKRYYRTLQSDLEDMQKITDYAVDKDMKHDLYFGNDLGVETSYLSSKNYMNATLHLSFVIVIILAITQAGVISKEHDKGTVKFLLSKPATRVQVLLSKFLYLVCAMYLLWLTAAVIMFFLSGFMYGFQDLFTPKLIIYNDQVIKLNYWLWYFKEMLICSIPVIGFLSVIFGLSTLTLSTPLTASVVSIVSVLSVPIWFLISNFKLTFLSFLSYTPIPYLDYWFVRYHSQYYLQANNLVGLPSSYGIIITLVLALILCVTSIYVYKKRDI